MESKQLKLKEKLPQIHEEIQSQIEDPNWENIYQDLKGLNLLRHKKNIYQQILQYSIQLQDICSVFALQQVQKYNVLSMKPVKSFLNSIVFQLSKETSNNRDLLMQLKHKIQTLQFFKNSKSTISNSDFALQQAFGRIHQVFSSLRQNLCQIFMHISIAFKADHNRSFPQFLDTVFYLNAVYHMKYHLKMTKFREVVENFENSFHQMHHSFSGYYGRVVRESQYFGELTNQKIREGYGTITLYNGDKYQGFWHLNKFHGQGKYFWKERGSYSGQFQSGAMHGYGKRIYSSGNVYTGNFKQNVKDGKGVMVFFNKDIYEGD